MTLKTTEARREAILLTARNAAYLFCEYANVPPGDLVSLCHDADEARRLKTEVGGLLAKLRYYESLLCSPGGLTIWLEDGKQKARAIEPSKVVAVLQENADLRAKLEEAAWALEVILPLAKGYAPERQTDTAKRTCRDWVAHADLVLSALKEQEK